MELVYVLPSRSPIADKRMARCMALLAKERLVDASQPESGCGPERDLRKVVIFTGMLQSHVEQRRHPANGRILILAGDPY